MLNWVLCDTTNSYRASKSYPYSNPSYDDRNFGGVLSTELALICFPLCTACIGNRAGSKRRSGSPIELIPNTESSLL